LAKVGVAREKMIKGMLFPSHMFMTSATEPAFNPYRMTMTAVTYLTPKLSTHTTHVRQKLQSFNAGSAHPFGLLGLRGCHLALTFT